MKVTATDADEFDKIANNISILKATNDAYNNRIREIMSGENENYSPLELGYPSQILLDAGFPNLRIQIAVTRLVDKKLQANHPFSLLSVVHMPEFLAEPIAIFQSKGYADRKVILTEMEDKGVNMVVAMELQRPKVKCDVNDIRSVYPKDNIKSILNWIAKDGLLEWADNKKVLKWLGKQQSISAEVARLLEDCTKIMQS
jgi:hypothetical protein